MHASFSRTLGVVGLLAISLTGCQSASLGKFSSWNPKNWKFGRKTDTALAANNATTTSADSTAGPWTPQLPSQSATPGYGATAANNSYAATSNQYGPNYPAVPTNYAADASQAAWGQPGATAAPSSDPNAYASAPAAPQAGYYGEYGQAPATAGYTQPQAGYGAPMTAAPTQQPANAWDPATQYGSAPTSYPQQQYGAPAAQLADNTQYPAATQYDGTQQPQGYGAQPAYGAQPGYGAPAGYETPAQQPGTQAYPQQYQPTGPAPAPQQYRPGGTTDYAPSTSGQVTPASYEPTQPAQGYGP